MGLQTAPDAEIYSIREVAQQLGVSAHTLRYYERQGLLSVPRADSLQRRYGAREVELLRFLLALRGTGMPIALIRRYMQLAYAGEITVTERRALLTEHQRAVTAQISALQADLDAIGRKIALYDRMSGQATHESTKGVN
ncbi:MerR family transcriptional regulator [Deinococcus sp. KNUC1210]|uniref:MerR family transcriptional regulator n=1 Tax=Deinococcus sp. KNUC1210 TaxID=2917691 RepID=UPI001EF10A46|nr:MerR family transcriptional regulator [Deinococcus sp. KNUC1210]ULH16859.1 MerR family transcriptional regulator [Deinococcus sp. KNUC1210]